MAVEKKQKLSRLHDICLSKNIPFVTYRLPAQNKIHSLLQYKSIPEKINLLNELDSSKGFIITPFRENGHLGSFILKPDISLENDSYNTELLTVLESDNLFINGINQTQNKLVETSNTVYTKQVEKIKSEIIDGPLEKVVLSRLHITDSPDKFHASSFFLELCNLYPNAFVYIIQMPMVGIWMGASPEPLIISQNETLYTVSLAGTQPFNGLPIEKVRWNTKEIEEQDYVTRYIQRSINEFGISNYKKQGPFNQKAANLIHLKSVFSFNSDELKNRLGSFVCRLHPTPSICGLPKSDALDFIKNTEKHDRNYYTGLLGPHNINNETHLFVNLRCMKVLPEKLIYYLGAGITSGSMPENEWEETNHKMKTLDDALKNTYSLE